MSQKAKVQLLSLVGAFVLLLGVMLVPLLTSAETPDGSDAGFGGFGAIGDAPAEGEAGAAPNSATFTYVEGQVQRQKGGAGNWNEVRENSKVRTGDRVKTLEETRAELELSESSVVRLDANTTMNVVELFKKDEKTEKVATALVVEQGTVFAQVEKLPGDMDFQLASPAAGASIRGTVFKVGVAKDKTTQVKVYEGEVAVHNPPPFVLADMGPGFKFGRPGAVAKPYKEVTRGEWAEIVQNMGVIVVGPDQSIRSKGKFKTTDADETTEWMKWNNERSQGFKAKK